MNFRNFFRVLPLMTVALGLGACSADSNDAALPSNGTGAGGRFVAADIAKTWSTACLTGSEPTTGANHYTLSLTLVADGTYSSEQLWYTGTCQGANYTIIYATSGTFVVGDYISGSTTIQSLVFTGTASTMMAMNDAIQTTLYSECGNTSPYAHSSTTPDSSKTGRAYTTYGSMACQHQNFPSSAAKTFNNVGSYSSSTLTLGANYDGLPGVFSTSSTPTTATITYN